MPCWWTKWNRRSPGAIAAGVIAAGVIGVGLATLGSPPVAAEPCWRPPVAGVVVDPFRAPPCRWCAGNRGLEYLVEAGSEVSAVATGTVTFAGVVVDTRYVVVRLTSGWLITYGQLDDSHLAPGDRVLAGSLIGRASDRFFLGVRVDGAHVDPARFVGRLVGRHRLVPVDGFPPRAAPPPRVSCHVEREGR